MAATQAGTLEICISSVDDALAAEAGGADRLELNVALELGGITPSLSLLEHILEATSLPVIAMNRPRAAGFCYSNRERLQMLRDAALLLEHGAAGIAAGVLRPDQTVDAEFWNQLVPITSGAELVFHRAFDLIVDQATAMEQLIELGTSRILTSGGERTALAGAAKIGRLVDRANGRIELLPAAGISAENIKEVLRITGCCQVHGSFSTMATEVGGVVATGTYPRTCQDQVAAARRALHRALQSGC